MNVAELIEELLEMPQHARVEVVLRSAIFHADGPLYLSDADAAEADEVRNMGPYVLIRSK